MTEAGANLLHNPILNKGTAFTPEERARLKLRGLLPPTIETMDKQIRRVKEQFDGFSKPIDRFVYLSSLKERNETLFYAFVLKYMEECLPVIYTPTVGEACIKLSHNWRVAAGMYLSKEDKGSMRSVLDNWCFGDVDIIVVTDGSRILGLGDLGANGMGIPIGKLSLYVCAGGFLPERTLPVMLDFGTNNQQLLADDLYIGERHPRLPHDEYYALVDEFMAAVKDKWPHCLVQFEDFSNDHCFEILDKFRNKQLCFNDDIQGTGAVVAAGFANAVKLSGLSFGDQRIVFYGAGSAGVGVASQIAVMMHENTGVPVEKIRKQFWFVDSQGLVTSTRKGNLEVHKRPWARTDVAADKQIRTLMEVVQQVKPTALIGLSGQGGSFSPSILEELFKHSQRPIVFPLSNPTSNSETDAKTCYTLSKGRCIFASGSPFAPVEVNGKMYYPGQGNNMYIFPGLGFGAWLCGAKVVTDRMISAAARSLADQVSEKELREGNLYPAISNIRAIEMEIAAKVMEVAYEEGVAQHPRPINLKEHVTKNVYWPQYATVYSNL